MSRALTRAKRPGEGGYALIEVLISALIVVLVSGAVIQTLVASGHSSANERHRSQAYAVAQEDQARLRSMQISKLQQGLAPHTVTLNGTPYSVTSAATYVSASTGATSCNGEGRADYVRIASSVTWPQMIEGAAPVSIESIVSPTTGSVDATSGGLAIYAHSPSQKIGGLGLSGSGPGSFSGSTDSNGCALFGGLPAGEYTVTPTLGPGWIEPSGEPPQQFSAVVSGGSTLNKELYYGKAGTATVTFSARNRSTGLFETSTTATKMIVRADSIVLSNVGPPITVRTWGTPGGASLATVEATSVFPFKSAYSVFAGSCAAPPKEEILQPEAAATASAIVPEEGNVNASVKLPTLYTTIYKTVGAKKEPVANVPVKVTDLHCKDSGGKFVTRRFRTIANGGLGENVTSPPPTLETPGLPTGEYEVCAYEPASKKHLFAKVLVKSVTGTTLSLDLAKATEEGQCE